MTIRFPFILIIIIMVFAQWTVNAQATEQELKAWIKLLSVRKDSKTIHLDSVARAIRLKGDDQVSFIAKQLKSASANANIRCQIRTDLLYYVFNGVPKSDGIAFLQGLLQKAYEIEDEYLQFIIHYRLGMALSDAELYGQASLHYLLTFDILKHNRREDFMLPSLILYSLTHTYFHTHEYKACIETGLKGFFVIKDPIYNPDDTVSPYYTMQMWNTLGLAYQKLHHSDSAFIAFNIAGQMAAKLGNPFWVGIINGNKGDVYYDLGQYDSAYALLQADVDISLASGQFDNAANSLQWIARIDLHNGKTGLALQKLKQARKYLIQMPKASFLANILFAYTQVYAALGKADSVNTYMQQYLFVHDGLQTELANGRAEILQMRINNQQQIQQIKILNRQKNQVTQTRNFTIVLVLLLSLLGYLAWTRMRLRLKIKQQQALEEKRIAETKAQQAIDQLETFRQHLVEKNAIIEHWQSTYDAREQDEDIQKKLTDLSHHIILNEEDWARFKQLFGSVYPGFFHALRNKVPDITQAEQRMAALIKLKLNARESANLLGVSMNTIYKTRQRLRLRIGLEQDADLDPFISETSE